MSQEQQRNPVAADDVRGRMKRLTSLTLLVVLLGACASTGDAPSTDGSIGPGVDVDGILTIAPGTAGGPGIGIEEAIGNGGGEPLLVNGALLIDPEGRVLLCEALAESFPPQCGGARLEVRGLDLDSLPDLQEGNGVRWAEQAQLLGTVTLIEH
ncbi:MAG TPA: hypothetical protein VEW95_12735 [Candidatus Limnocylindrales bacterium]|nr:hypothetical protein [Candidatus Limnocylindrales bacterium]